MARQSVSWFCNKCGYLGTAPVPPPGDEETARLAAIDHHDQCAAGCNYHPAIIKTDNGALEVGSIFRSAHEKAPSSSPDGDEDGV